MVRELYKKSVLFEIINKQNPSEIVEAFTLTVPPENIEIVQSQRVSRTKTFGGIFEDDYGMDTAKITISGHTGNQELRATYIPGQGSPRSFSGKEAIYEFRNKIIRYKVYLEDRGLENYEIRWYDLSVLNSDVWESADPSVAVHGSIEAWVVSLDDFKISRNKDKPLWYNYSIDLLGITPLGVVRGAKPPDMGEPIVAATPYPDTMENITSELAPGTQVLKQTKDNLQDAIGAIRRTINAITNAVAWTQNLLNKIDNVNKLISDLSNQVTEYIHAAGNIVTTGFGIYKRMFEIAKFPGAVAKATMQEVVNVMEELKNTIEFNNNLKTILGDDYLQVIQLANETKRIAVQIVAFGKSQKSDTEINVDLDGTEVTVYGSRSAVVDSGTTLAQLSVSEYGDASKEILLSMYNGITDQELVPGLEIRIPLIVRTVQNYDNRIFSWDKLSQYGNDIKIDANGGEIIFSESGDFSMIANEQNLIQAINLRLNEYLGNRLRLTTYGLKAAVGSARNNSAPVSYIVTNIMDTLMQDPRVQDVEDLKIKGDGDRLYIAFNTRTVEGDLTYEGGI